ncbi:hypothetical protein N2152v2_005736 [Parachlorella kessleri]
MSRSHYSGHVTVGISKVQPGSDIQQALAGDVGRQLDAVGRLFEAWQAEAQTKRVQSLAARGFPSGTGLEQALLVFNKRGERRKGARKAQDWYFAARRHTAESSSQLCARCYVCVSRQEVYYVDKAKEWRQAEELCRHCLQCVMRSLLGEDDAAIFQEAGSILESGWSPVINPRLADALVERRTFFSVL